MRHASSLVRLLLVLVVALAAAAVSVPRADAQTGASTAPDLTQAMPVVELGAIIKVEQDGQQSLKVLTMGTGTVLSGQGSILTDSYVADLQGVAEALKSRPEVKQVYQNSYLVMVTNGTDQPTTPAFIASLTAEDKNLGLALLTPAQDLSGKPVDVATLNMPSLTVSPTEPQAGGQIAVYGYPKSRNGLIGGQRVTVKGPQQQADGTKLMGINEQMEVGFAGGPATDAESNFVGIVSTKGGSREGLTNVVPVSSMQALLQQAVVPLSDNTCTAPGGCASPSPQPGPAATATPGAGPSGAATPAAGPTGSFGPIRFRTSPAGPAQEASASPTFPAGATELYAEWDYQNMSEGALLKTSWVFGGQPVLENSETWTLPGSGATSRVIGTKSGNPLPDGQYGFQLYLNGQQVQSGTATIGSGGSGTGPTPSTEGVRLTGKVTDALSAQPIVGASFIVLKEGVTWSTAKSKDDVLDTVTTDQSGTFMTSAPLKRGVKYSVGISMQGYQAVAGTIDVPASGPSILDVGTLQMQTQAP